MRSASPMIVPLRCAKTWQLPQAYLALPTARRQAVREEVEARLAAFETDGRLVMHVEMLIGAGRA